MRTTGEKIQNMATAISKPEIGRVKKLVQVPLYWKALSIFFSRMGPRIKARIRGEVGSPPQLIRIPITAKAIIIPHLYRLPDSE